MKVYQSSLLPFLVLPGLASSDSLRTRKLQTTPAPTVAPTAAPTAAPTVSPTRTPLAANDITVPVGEDFTTLFGMSSYNLLDNTAGSDLVVTRFDGTAIAAGDTGAVVTISVVDEQLDLFLKQDGSIDPWLSAWSFPGARGSYSVFAYLAEAETFTYSASFTVEDTVTGITDTATFTLSVTGQNDAPVRTMSSVSVYDITAGLPIYTETAFAGISDPDTPVATLQVYAIDGVVVTSFPATATGAGGGTFTVEATGVVSFEDAGNELVSGDHSKITLTITDGFGGFVDKKINVEGM